MKDVVSCEKLRGAAKQALIRRFLNGETFLAEGKKLPAEYIGRQRQRGELKHLSNPRKGKKPLLP